MSSNKQNLTRSSLTIVSPMLVTLLALTLLPHTKSVGNAQTQARDVQSMAFEVGRRPEALVFDGNHIWVANQQSDSLMKLRAIDGMNLGTFPTGTRPDALTYDG
jgi:hypothetical protein